ncbi:hypothetical protein MCOR27_001219 [Pyricularia oryzae]|uniref:Cyclin N-terminal domain-containing protein n=4 Tax=Pyricularia TaxID=48558 RepID=A0ABQ8NJI9_PYRGI|nr:hypothetical protein MCOR01_008176 [Pyricularia oryzae]KAI6297559.1 hypothetical protein MCOR33_006144 [Pyricularia grisea]KAH9438765.1 hypothetical protein MCOR02_002367 [Pyricularia oryzae]KAI6256262.1 hypothetical protein MCOR19_007264 [Pyricularia oryzae]KAI6270647.1 hypothetical protein MCOR26_008153 [Pyricularia oryzae]
MAFDMRSNMSPSLAKKVVDEDMSDDEFDFDEEYFMRTYKPLSNLPTPPPSSQNSSAALSPMLLEMQDGEMRDPAFFGAAVHLVNLLPPAASLATPSVPIVHAILTRSDLPLHTVALAVCIMDSLGSKFPRAWRTSCPLMPMGPDSDFDVDPDYTHTNGHMEQRTRLQHIDSVSPELIVLASLVIAAKFTDDSQESTRWYAGAWGSWMWSCDQINTTERCIMENLGYRIMPLTAPDILDDAITDMARAAKSATSHPGCGNSSGSSSSSSRGGYATPVTPASSCDDRQLGAHP